MFCAHCGSENSATAKFCVSCGVALGKAPTPGPVPVSPEVARRAWSGGRTVGLLMMVLILGLGAAGIYVATRQAPMEIATQSQLVAAAAAAPSAPPTAPPTAVAVGGGPTLLPAPPTATLTPTSTQTPTPTPTQLPTSTPTPGPQATATATPGATSTPAPEPTPSAAASEADPTVIAQQVIGQANATWAAVIARSDAPISDLDQVYAGTWLSDVRRSTENMRAQRQYRVARLTRPITVRGARVLADGRVEAFTSEDWDDRLYSADGSLVRTFPGHVEQRYVLEQRAGRWFIVESELARS